MGLEDDGALWRDGFGDWWYKFLDLVVFVPVLFDFYAYKNPHGFMAFAMSRPCGIEKCF